MKAFAKSLVKAGLPVRREGQQKTAPPPTTPVAEKPLPSYSVYRQHDSWSPSNRKFNTTFTTPAGAPAPQTTNEPPPEEIDELEAEVRSEEFYIKEDHFKKTRSGLTTKELAEQISADARHYSARG